MKNESNTGWNGAEVAVGNVVKVRAPGFGKGVMAKVLALGGPAEGATRGAKIEITRTTPKSCWQVGNQASVGVWWLEGAL